MSEFGRWEPIETAPKDGSPFIGSYFDKHSSMYGDVVRCWWQNEFQAFISSCREMSLAPGYTFGDGSTVRLHSPSIEEVTHWIPLPPPPAE